MVVAFGEMLLRLSPPGHQRLQQANRLEMHFGGSEANAAVSLAQFGRQVRFITGLPTNAIGYACKGELQRWGVDTASILMKEGRMGLYFYEKGASQRPSRVLYDRADSVFSRLPAASFDWDALLQGADWLHFSGITPALSEELTEATMAACQAAKKKGVPVSCDVNYRSALWSREKASEVMTALLPCVDVLIAGREEAGTLFGIGGTEEEASQLLAERFALSHVAMPMRQAPSASVNSWSALLYDGRACRYSKTYTMELVDRIGGGDGFAAGLIYGLTAGYDSQRTLEFAAAAACLKHSVEGDFNVATLSEVEALAQSSDGGSDAGRVRR